MDWLQETTHGVVLTLRVVPRAARADIQGVLGDALKIRLTAPPVDDKANTELIRFLADRLEVSAGCVHLLAGRTGRQKRVRLQGLTAAQVRARLGGGDRPGKP